MNILTQCPHCRTVFRIDTVELLATTGQARCGVCDAAFNALEHHIHEALEQKIQPTPHEDLAEEETSAFEFMEYPIELSTLETENRSIHESEIRVIHKSEAHPVVGAVTSMRLPPNNQPDAQDNTFASHVTSSERPPTPQAHLLGASRNIQQNEADGALSTAQQSSVKLDTQPFKRNPSRLSTWVLGTLNVLLVVCVALQIAWQQRDYLSLIAPPIGPSIAKLCKWTGCKVQLPQDVNQLKLISTELAQDTAHPQWLHVRFTMQNLSTLKAALPAIALTLSSESGATSVQKNIIAQDYAEQDNHYLTAIPANSELPIELTLDTGNLNVSNYKLLLFYPRSGD